MKEIWRDIKDYEGLYQISNMGRVKSLDRVIVRYNGHTQHLKEKILKPCLDSKGYYFIVLNKNGKSSQQRIHRLIAEHFIPNPENKPCVDHINTDPTDNRIVNLRWCTHTENMNNAFTKQKHKEVMTGRCSKMHPRSRKVLQYSMDGTLLNEWESMADVTRNMGLTQGHISNCCRGICKSAGGYMWKYYDTETYLIGLMNKNFKLLRNAS